MATKNKKAANRAPTSKDLKAAETRWRDAKQASREAKAAAKDAKKAVKQLRKQLEEGERQARAKAAAARNRVAAPVKARTKAKKNAPLKIAGTPEPRRQPRVRKKRPVLAPAPVVDAPVDSSPAEEIPAPQTPEDSSGEAIS